MDNVIGKEGKKVMNKNGKQKISSFFIALLTGALLVCTLAGCAGGQPVGPEAAASEVITPREEGEKSKENDQPSQETKDLRETMDSQGSEGEVVPSEPVTIRVGALKGPTTMGLLFLMEEQRKGTAGNDYEFQMATGADELLPLMVSGKLDVALVPANVAAILYQKTEGGVVCIDINTLGVLYLVSGDPAVAGLRDLGGRTIYLTGKGTTPDYVLQYLLKSAGFAEGEVNLEYKSEATEVAAILARKEDAVGFLPQPFVTAAMLQNESLQLVLSANDAWMEAQGDENAGGQVTGVTIVRKAFLEEHPDAVKTFLAEHAASAKAIGDDVETGARLAAEAGIVGKEAIAKKAIPYCNVTCITGEEMKRALESYLEVLYGFDPTSVGGKLPEEDFYYLQ